VARALIDNDEHVQEAAKEVLGRIIPEDLRFVSCPLIEPLVEDYNSPEWRVSHPAELALIRLGIAEPFVAALWNERKRNNASYVLQERERIGRKAVPLLEKQLSQTQDYTREVVRLSAPLPELANHQEVNFTTTRQYIVTLLGKLGDSSVEDTLWRERHHWDEGVQAAAEWALERIKGVTPRSAPMLEGVQAKDEEPVEAERLARRLAKAQQRSKRKEEKEGEARLEALLILFNREFSPKQQFVDSILNKMQVRGRSYREWIDVRTPVIVQVRANPQDPATFLATATVEFQKRLNKRIDIEKTEYATFEGSQDTSGVIVTLWNR